MDTILTAKTKLKFEDWDKIDKYFKEKEDQKYFACFPNLLVTSMVSKKDIFFISWQGKKRIVFYNRRFIKDIRILFESYPEDSGLIEKLWKQLNPEHIGYSFVDSIPKDKKMFLEEPEYVQNLKNIVKMEGRSWRKIRQDYNHFIKTYPLVQVVEATKEHKKAIFKFFKEWAKFATDYFGYDVDMKEDKAFIKAFLGNPKTPGALFLDKEKVIGIEFHTYCPGNKKIAICVLGKNLRGYRGLGDFICITQAKKMLKEGYTEMNVYSGGKEGETKFKEKYMDGGRTIPQRHYFVKLQKKTKADKHFLSQVFYV